MHSFHRSCSTISIIGRHICNNLKFQHANFSTSQCSSQCSETKTSQKDHDIVDIYKEFPIKLKSVKTNKDVNVNLNVRTIHKHDCSPSNPVILALHGMPGDATDFEDLSYTLAGHDFRCILPDFPGFGRSEVLPGDVYKIDYSPEGKEDMFNRILDGLELDRVDVLVSHSAGSLLGFRAAAEIDRIKSAVFLNFLGGKPHRFARPLKLIQLMNEIMKRPLLQPLYMSFLPELYVKIGFARYDAQPLQLAVENVATAEYAKILEHAETIRIKKIPTVFAWATTDKVLELDIPFNIIRHIGITDSLVTNLCRENQVKENTSDSTDTNDHLEDWYFKAIQFDRGGHLLQKNQIPELTKQIKDLLKHIHR